MDEITFKLIRDKAEVDILIALRSSIDEVYMSAKNVRKTQMTEAGYNVEEPDINRSCHTYALADTMEWLLRAVDQYIEIGIATMESTSEIKH